MFYSKRVGGKILLLVCLAAAALHSGRGFRGGFVVGAENAAAAAPDGADERYRELFGDEAKQVEREIKAQAKVEYAAKILKTTNQLHGDPELAVFICRKAYDLAMKDVSGYPTAIESMEALSRLMPEHRVESAEKRLAACRLWVRRVSGSSRQQAGDALGDALLEMGDADNATGNSKEAIRFYKEAIAQRGTRQIEAEDRLKKLAEKQQLQQKIDRLEARLRANSQDSAAAKELTETYLVDVYDSAAAARVAPASADATLKRIASLASREGAELNETEQLELADWYKSTAQRPLDNLVKAGLLSRARSIYQAVLDAHAQEDAVRLRAQMQLSQSDAALAKLPPPPDLSRWVDLLPKADIGKANGKWQWNNSTIDAIPSSGKRFLPLDLKLNKSHQWRFVVEHTAGNGTLVVHLSIGGYPLHLEIDGQGAKGAFTALNYIEEKPAEANSSTVLGALKLKRPYGFLVREEINPENFMKLSIDRDGQKLIRFSEQLPPPAADPVQIGFEILGDATWVIHHCEIREQDLPGPSTAPSN